MIRDYSDVIMNAMASQITGASIVNSAVCSEHIKVPRHWPFVYVMTPLWLWWQKGIFLAFRSGNSNPCLSETHLFIAGLYCCWLLASRSPLSLIGAHDVWWSYEMAGLLKIILHTLKISVNWAPLLMTFEQYNINHSINATVHGNY